MDAFDWYHVLTPLALIVCSTNFLLSFAIKPEFRSMKIQTFSTMSYLGCLLGWLIMLLAISVKSIDLLVKFSIIGWLILLPSILLSAGCAVSKLRHPSLHYFQQAIQLKNVLVKCIKFLATLLIKLFQAIFLLIVGFLSYKKRRQHYQIEEDENLIKKCTNSSTGYGFGNPPQNAFGGIVDPGHEDEGSCL